MNDVDLSLKEIEEQIRSTAMLNRPRFLPCTDYEEVMAQAQHIVSERAKIYDLNGASMTQNLDTIAKLATLKLDREITPYMVAIILESVKDARRAVNPKLVDAHLDGINYRAVATQFALADATAT